MFKKLPSLLLMIAAGAVGNAFAQAQYGANNFTQPFPLKPFSENSLNAKWAAKTVKKSKLITNFETDDYKWTVAEGIGKLSIVSDNAYDGKRSLRYVTSLRDSVHINSPSERSQWNSFGGQQGGFNRWGITFDQPQDWTQYNRVSVWVYIHPNRNKSHHFAIEIVNEGTDYSETLQPRHEMVVQDLEGGEWHQVLWEFTNLARNKVKKLNFFQTLVGYEPGCDEFEVYDFDRVEVQQVDSDNYQGWAVPKGQFAFSHVGYRPSDTKTVIAAASSAKDFKLVDDKGNVAYTGTATVTQNTKGDSFSILDFSAFRKPGSYMLSYDGQESKPFRIDDDVWLEPLFAGLNFYFCQRCGYPVPGIHDNCHQDWQAFYGDEKKVINGGWHDAGDMSQGYFRTAIGTWTLLKNMQNVDGKTGKQTLADRLNDEALWGTKWLVKNHFKDGYHMGWGRQRIFSDNKLGTWDDVVIKTTNVPWQNFLGAAVLAKAEMTLKNLSEGERQAIDAVAKDNWEQAYKTSNWQKSSYLEASYGAVAAVELWKLTGDEKYREAAYSFGRLLTMCQEQTFVEGIPITGYFYTDTDRRNLVHNNHGSYSEAPMVALHELCDAFSDAPDYMDWIASAALYSQCYLKEGSKVAAPFDVLPNGVFRKADIERQRNARSRQFSLIQYNDGTKLNDNYALRTFPIWDGDLFHGGTCCNLASTWAMAEAAQLLNDTDGLQLAKEQLEWTLGRNPFGQSLMFGVGYNYQSLFAYCTRNYVGGLPVGMDSFSNDAPYWHGSNYATSKEIWIGTTNRFMGAVAAFTAPMDSPDVKVTATKAGKSGYTLSLTGTGKHDVAVKVWNGKTNIGAKSVSLVDGKASAVKLALSRVDKDKPAVAVIYVDGKKAATVVK